MLEYALGKERAGGRLAVLQKLLAVSYLQLAVS